MNAYEGLVGMMGRRGAVANSAEIQTAVMTGANTCQLGELPLDAEDLIFAEHLLKPVLSKLQIQVNPDSGAVTDYSAYLEPLKKGDIVAVQRLSDSCYMVLEKLVSL